MTSVGGGVVLERTGFTDARRIRRNGKVIAIVMQLSNQKWALYGIRAERLDLRAFDTPEIAFRHWKHEIANAEAGER